MGHENACGSSPSDPLPPVLSSGLIIICFILNLIFHFRTCFSSGKDNLLYCVVKSNSRYSFLYPIDPFIRNVVDSIPVPAESLHHLIVQRKLSAWPRLFAGRRGRKVNYAMHLLTRNICNSNMSFGL